MPASNPSAKITSEPPGVFVNVGEGPVVAVFVGVRVAVAVGVFVNVGEGPVVAVFVGVGVLLEVGVRVGVLVNVAVGTGPVDDKLNPSTSLADRFHVLPSK